MINLEMQMRSLTLVIVFLLGVILLAHAQKAFDPYLQAQQEAHRFRGSVLVAKGSEIVFEGAYGLASEEYQVENKTDSKYLLGSITKTFTAYAVWKLMWEKGRSLDSQIADFGYEFSSADEITIDHLLDHRSGLRDYYDLPDWKKWNKLGRKDYQLVDETAKLPLYFEPGEGFHYSNTGYIILGEIIEKISGKSFSEFILQEVCEELALSDTGVMDNQKLVVGLSTGYNSNPRDISQAEYVDYSIPFSSGNMYSTVGDLYKFWKFIQGKEGQIEELFPTGGKPYSKGWAAREFFGKQGYGHYGRMNGFVASVLAIPSEDIFIAILANDDNVPIYQMTADLLAICIGKDYQTPQKRKILNLSLLDFEKYRGEYVISPGDSIKVFSELERYYIQESGQPKHEIYPFEKDKFFFKLLEFDLIFEEFQHGKMQKMILRLQGKDIMGIRKE